jgi:predicted transcriptional regulator
MNLLRINVATKDSIIADIMGVIGEGKEEHEAIYSFPTYEALHRTLTPKRLAIVEAMTGQGALTMREVSRLVARDFKGVHTDITELLNVGILERDSAGKVTMPFDELRIDIAVHRHAA